MKYIYLLIASSILSACISKPAYKIPPAAHVPVDRAPNVQKNSATTLLQYAFALGDMSKKAQKNELKSLLSGNQNSIHDRIKTAMIYALPNSSLRNTGKALPILDDLNKELHLANDDLLIIKLLSMYTNESKNSQRKISAARKKANHLNKKNSELLKKSESLQTQASTLKKQLDALKNIEKNMADRNQGAR